MEVGERWLLSKEVGGSISFRRSGGDVLFIDRQGFNCHMIGDTTACMVPSRGEACEEVG